MSSDKLAVLTMDERVVWKYLGRSEVMGSAGPRAMCHITTNHQPGAWGGGGGVNSEVTITDTQAEERVGTHNKICEEESLSDIWCTIFLLLK